jgi:hypothetical protein
MIYVDKMQLHQSGEWCHMITDSENLDELHAMADKLKLKREWFQDTPNASFPHYDLRRSKRALAIANGAVEATMMDMVTIMRASPHYRRGRKDKRKTNDITS